MGRLEVVGFFHLKPEKGDSTDILHVFGRTPGIPPRYFYRQRVNGTRWTPWEKVEVDIEGDHLLPVVFNRRLYIFWSQFTETAVEDDDAALTVDLKGDSHTANKPLLYYQISLAWSKHRNGKWAAKTLSKVQIGRTQADYERQPDALRKTKDSSPADFFFCLDEEDGDLIISPIRSYSSSKKARGYYIRLDRFRFSACDGAVSVIYGTKEHFVKIVAGNPAVYLFKGSRHVVYRDKNGYVHELKQASDRWQETNPTTVLSAPIAVGDPVGLVTNDTKHVVYRDVNNHIQVLQQREGVWERTDLNTAPIGAPLAAGNPAACEFLTTPLVVYRDVNGNIQQLWQREADWHLRNLTAGAREAYAESDPSVFILGTKGSLYSNVVYCDGDGSINRLLFVVMAGTGSEKIGGQNITKAVSDSDAPLVIGKPSSYVLNNKAHVVYRDGNGNIQELWSDNEGEWHVTR